MNTMSLLLAKDFCFFTAVDHCHQLDPIGRRGCTSRLCHKGLMEFIKTHGKKPMEMVIETRGLVRCYRREDAAEQPDLLRSDGRFAKKYKQKRNRA